LRRRLEAAKAQSARIDTTGIEESTKLKKLLLSILAMVSALFMPLAATSQIAPDRLPRAPQTEPSNKYEVFAGYGYTSINQINGSRYGLQGVNASVTRDWGRFFGLTADGAYYKSALAGCNSGSAGITKDECNPGNPSVEAVLFGPVVHANIFRQVDGFFHVLLGGEHTGGEYMTPKVSFAGGVGIGMDYKLTKRFAVRLSGDTIASSFSLRDNSPEKGWSPHRTRSARASFGLVYKF
jgi:hypothetical protein